MTTRRSDQEAAFLFLTDFQREGMRISAVRFRSGARAARDSSGSCFSARGEVEERERGEERNIVNRSSSSLSLTLQFHTLRGSMREIFAERSRIGCSSVPPAYTCLFLPIPYRDEAPQHGIGDCALRHGKELGVREHGVFSFEKRVAKERR